MKKIIYHLRESDAGAGQKRVHASSQHSIMHYTTATTDLAAKHMLASIQEDLYGGHKKALHDLRVLAEQAINASRNGSSESGAAHARLKARFDAAQKAIDDSAPTILVKEELGS